MPRVCIPHNVQQPYPIIHPPTTAQYLPDRSATDPVTLVIRPLFVAPALQPYLLFLLPRPIPVPNTSRILCEYLLTSPPLPHPSNILTAPLICPEAAVFAVLPTRVGPSPRLPFVLFFFFFSIKSYFSENNRHGCPKPGNHRN